MQKNTNMKRFRRILLALVALLLILILGLWIYLQSTAPKYKGQAKLPGLQQEVEVVFDEYGIPHIYAQNAPDAYRAMGYIHAQDRLFQMEMLRRLSSGRLSEILGPELKEVDELFRTLGFRQKAEQQVAAFRSAQNQEWLQLAQSYLNGINAFIDEGPTPPEFTLIGIPKTKFDLEDVYTIVYYMALGFTNAVHSDAAFAKIRSELGPEYTKYWEEAVLPSSQQSMPASEEGLFHTIGDALEKAGLPLWTGSNAWVLAPSRSASGHAILANDTHIHFSQPSVWYEAYMNYPGFEFYGYFLAGVPYAILGHNNRLGWGLTIYPIDNLDLYQEKTKPDNPKLILQDSAWIPLQERKETISVKGEDSYQITVQSSPRGPIVNKIVDELTEVEEPVSLWWSLLHLNSRFLETLYHLQRCQNLEEFQQYVSGIDLIGLNVLYADADDHIAWWGTGKIPKRNPGVNPFFMLDASNPLHLPADSAHAEGAYLPFDQNPHSIDPPSGFIVSANNRPTEGPAHYYPGYYLPDDRFLRINQLLAQKEKWSLEDCKTIQGDVYSGTTHQMAQLFAGLLQQSCNENENLIQILANWDGQLTREATAPVIYHKLLYFLLHDALSDELGEESLQNMLGWYAIKKGIPKLLQDPQAPWWDDRNTPEQTESREDILCQAWQKTTAQLQQELGDNPDNWQWGKVHTLTHIHPVGQKKPLDKIFNLGPFPMDGGNLVPMQMKFDLNPSGQYDVLLGPALRILIDFARPDQSYSINPTGQSGHFMSPHYGDQAQMYVDKKYRKQISKREDMELTGTTLLLKP